MPRPFTLNNNYRKVRMVSVCFNLVWGENRTFVQRKRETRDDGLSTASPRKKREGGWRGYWVPTGEEIEEAAEPDVPDGLVPKLDLTPS